ncbi:ribbon-helix-helix protein, CopG family [Microbacterium tumbae]
MAMTVRLPEELDARIETIARERHVSKHAVLIEAATRFADTESKTARVLAAVDEVGQQYADAIARLEDA